MGGRCSCHPSNNSLRIKTLSVLSEGIVQKIGHIEAPVFSAGDVSIDDLNDIEFKFDQVGDPVFNIRILRNKVINCGFIRIAARAIIFPETIPPDIRNFINNIFFYENNQARVLSIKLQGETEVCGVREDDEVEEFFDFEGAAACFVLRSGTIFSSVGAGAFTYVFLVVKAAVNVRIIVSRIKLANERVSDIEDINDFSCVSDVDPWV